jgi:hypothetical protein
MSEDTYKTHLSTDPFRALDVELMHFKHMPGVREMSLFTKGVRILNMTPRISLNLLAWLQEHKDELEHLAGEK